MFWKIERSFDDYEVIKKRRFEKNEDVKRHWGINTLLRL